MPRRVLKPPDSVELALSRGAGGLVLFLNVSWLVA